MRAYSRTVLVLFLVLGFVSAATAQISIGIEIGAPPPPRVIRVQPPPPGPEFIWIPGYWYPVANRYVWHVGYWTRPPYAGAVWVVPRHDGERFFGGYWDGPRGRFEHDHRWDRDGDRDYDRHDRDDRR